MLRFYAGKGGAGKTTCAAAVAHALARGGKRTLLVSTDPAHSLGDALEARLSASPRAVRGKLYAAQMDADRALSRWLGARERSLRAIASRGTYLDDEDIDSLFRLSLPGVDELVGLTELRRLSRGFDEVVVDTAPTGHTLRLLAMPATLARLGQVLDDLQAKHRALARSLRGSVRRDAEDALIDELQEEARSLHELLRSAEAQFHWVTLPEELALQETRDGVSALRQSGLRVERLIANRLTPKADGPCSFCLARRAEEARVLERARAIGLPLYGVPEQAREPRGSRDLSAVALALRSPLRSGRIRNRTTPLSVAAPVADQDWLEDIAGA
jgi:arsenite-transporting ATPase